MGIGRSGHKKSHPVGWHCRAAEPTYKVAQEISRKLNIGAGIVLGVC